MTASEKFQNIKHSIHKQKFDSENFETLEQVAEIFKNYNFNATELEFLNVPFYIERLNYLEQLRDLIIAIKKSEPNNLLLVAEIMSYWATITGTGEDYLLSEELLLDLLEQQILSEEEFNLYDRAKPVNRWL